MAKKKIFQEELTQQENLIRYQRLFRRYKGLFEGIKIIFQLVILLILLYIVLVQLNYICYESNLFRIQEIQVRGNQTLTQGEIILQSGLYNRQHLSEINIEQTERRISLLPYIRECRVTYKSLDNICVEVKERTPKVIAVTNLGFVELDNEMVALNVIEDNGKLKNLPLITGVQLADLQIGKSVMSRKIQKGMEWVNTLNKNHMDKISEINVSNPDLTYLYLDNGVKVYCDCPQKFVEKYEQMNKVTRQLHKNGIFFEYINISHESGFIVKPL